MRRALFSLLILALPSVIAAATDSETREERTDSVSELRQCDVRVQPPDASATSRSRRRQRGFSAREVSDLRFDVWLLESQSSHPAEVRVYTPTGNLFKVLRVGMEASPLNGRAHRRSRRGLTVLSARLALLGTHVTSRSLYGTWRAEAYFVGDESPCSHSLDFAIRP